MVNPENWLHFAPQKTVRLPDYLGLCQAPYGDTRNQPSQSPTQTISTTPNIMLPRLTASSSRALLSLRTITTTPYLLAARPNFDRPSPPPLPASDQAEFDALLKANASIGATPAITSPAEDVQHRDLRRGPKKDFEGDENPRTGERGGPKVDPFKAGDQDWQYGGRVTVSLSTNASR